MPGPTDNRGVETRLAVLSQDVKEMTDAVNRLTSYLQKVVESNSELVEAVGKYLKAIEHQKR